jgi:hypothetical protein
MPEVYQDLPEPLQGEYTKWLQFENQQNSMWKNNSFSGGMV